VLMLSWHSTATCLGPCGCLVRPLLRLATKTRLDNRIIFWYCPFELRALEEMACNDHLQERGNNYGRTALFLACRYGYNSILTGIACQ
jgi:hypothetical protein